MAQAMTARNNDVYEVTCLGYRLLQCDTMSGWINGSLQDTDNKVCLTSLIMMN